MLSKQWRGTNFDKSYAAESEDREERKIKMESEKTKERMNALEILNDFV